jgi:hypothetical protein
VKVEVNASCNNNNKKRDAAYFSSNISEGDCLERRTFTHENRLINTVIDNEMNIYRL